MSGGRIALSNTLRQRPDRKRTCLAVGPTQFTSDTTKQFSLCRVWRGGVNWISDNSRLYRHTTHDTDRTVLSRLVWQCELSRLECQTGAFCAWSVSECVGRRSATAGRTPTQNALVGRSGRLNSHRLTRHIQDCLVVSGRRCELGIKIVRQ